MKGYTRAHVFEIEYACFDYAEGVCVDNFIIGYFASRDEVIRYLKDEILDGENYTVKSTMVKFDDELAPLEHCYRVTELKCGVGSRGCRRPVVLDL